MKILKKISGLRDRFREFKKETKFDPLWLVFVLYWIAASYLNMPFFASVIDGIPLAGFVLAPTIGLIEAVLAHRIGYHLSKADYKMAGVFSAISALLLGYIFIGQIQMEKVAIKAPILLLIIFILGIAFSYIYYKKMDKIKREAQKSEKTALMAELLDFQETAKETANNGVKAVTQQILEAENKHALLKNNHAVNMHNLEVNHDYVIPLLTHVWKNYENGLHKMKDEKLAALHTKNEERSREQDRLDANAAKRVDDMIKAITVQISEEQNRFAVLDKNHSNELHNLEANNDFVITLLTHVWNDYNDSRIN